MEDVNQRKNSQGVYVLVFERICSLLIEISRFKWLLKSEFYLYFGSARGKTSTSLEKRLGRHFKGQKKIFWHIDNVTSHSDTKMISAYYTTTTGLTECSALQGFVQNFHNTEIIQNFGSSDCKAKCGGHLVFFSSNWAVLIDLENYFILRGWFLHED
ncbi:MAG: DUF123 domain-containing protein [Candidatus Heimdallarchaeota archaeon]|nr:MAG: DUF123 domain-containing protein [Candidatus Heimdallarchaeota archaeon]